MKTAYILQNENYEAVGIALEESEAQRICKDRGWTYRLLPLFIAEHTIVKMINNEPLF